MSSKLSDKNLVVVASAGARKTTRIVEEAISAKGKRILITTFTNENVDQIKSFFLARCGAIPENVTVLSWYTFLLRHGIRPYQNQLTERKPIEITFEELPERARYTKRTEADRYFFDSAGLLFKDRAADFVCECDKKTSGKVIGRIGRLFDHIYLDELQDLASWDLEVLKLLFEGSPSVTAVGDPRQGTFATSRGTKNAQYRGSGILQWIYERKEADLVRVEEKVDCYRSNQVICDFADELYPGFPQTKSMNVDTTGHDGIFRIRGQEVMDYVQKYAPVVLRWKRTADTMGLAASNIGASKGRTFDRVIIFPTQPMLAYYKNKDLAKLKPGAISMFYVAVTRARFSVAIVEM